MATSTRHRQSANGLITPTIVIEGRRNSTIPLDDSFDKSDCLVTTWKPLLRLLQFWGFHTAPVSGRRFLTHFRWSYLLYLWAGLIDIVNVAILAICVYTTYCCWTDKKMGPFHSRTVSSIITGVLPLQNLFNLIIFQWGQKIHRQLLEQMKFVDNQLRTKINAKLDISAKISGIYILCCVTILPPMTIRILEIYVQGQSYLDPFIIFSLLVVPPLRVWQMLPLFYLEMLNSSVRFWFAQLNDCVHKDTLLRRNSLNFYYKQFLQLTVVVFRLGEWLNPFIFFSLAFNLVLLCFTIHFFTQTPKNLLIPTGNLTDTELADAYDSQFNLTYTVLQVVLAIVYIISICVSGRKTNEEAREILPIVLAIRAPTDEDRFAVIRFVQKLSTQYFWGVTVWRTFPIERSLLFTIFGTVFAWAILLVNMSSRGDCISPATLESLRLIRNKSSSYR